jgi:hypothetical protein
MVYFFYKKIIHNQLSFSILLLSTEEVQTLLYD